jgi:hypothetical protein
MVRLSALRAGRHLPPERVWYSLLLDSRTQGHSAAGRIRPTSRPGRFTPGERDPCTHWIGGRVGTRAVLDDVEKRKFLTLPGLELRPLGRPARSQSLYRLSYPDSNRHSCQRKVFYIQRDLLYGIL